MQTSPGSQTSSARAVREHVGVVRVGDDTMSVPGGGGTIDAFLELQQLGEFGPYGLHLLIKLVGEEIRRFPVLTNPGATSCGETAEDWTQAFFVAKGKAVTAAVLAQTVDVASMARYLRRSVRHFLVDAARRTPLGAVRRKIEDLLAATPEFAQTSSVGARVPRWQLTGGPAQPYGGDLDPLVAAARAVPDVLAARWSGERRAPLTSDASLVAVLRAVLNAAGGSLESAQLTAVVARRFPPPVEYADATLDELTFHQAAAPIGDRPEVIVEVSDRAQDVHAQLSPSQRVLLPHLDGPVSDQAQTLGLGRSQTYQAAAKLKALLVELLPDDDLRADVTRELLRLCVVHP